MSNKRKLTEEDDMFSCPICFENYQASGDHLPRIFPCSHTACHECIKRLLRRNPQLVGNKHVHRPSAELVCPKCRKKHAAENEVKSFPENPYVLKMVEDKEKKKSTEFQMCESHKRELSLYCKDKGCNQTICQLCLVKNHRNHNVVDIIEEHRNRLKGRTRFLSEMRFEQQLVRKKSKDNLEMLRQQRTEYINKFDSMIKEVESKVARSESNIQDIDDELERVDDMAKQATGTGKAAPKDIQLVQNDVANQAKKKLSCSYFAYQTCTSTDNPCGQLVQEEATIPELQILSTFSIGDSQNSKSSSDLKLHMQALWNVKDLFLWINFGKNSFLSICSSRSRSFI